jgi:hypothetical protein
MPYAAELKLGPLSLGFCPSFAFRGALCDLGHAQHFAGRAIDDEIAFLKQAA